MTFTNLEAAQRELQAGIRDVQSDNPNMDIDEFGSDLIDSMRTECTVQVFGELCRTELGWIPSASIRELNKTAEGRKLVKASARWLA
jgi:hypothetical protein